MKKKHGTFTHWSEKIGRIDFVYENGRLILVLLNKLIISNYRIE